MNCAEKIIAKFAGTRAMAALLGIAPSTVQSWKDTGRIPAKHQQSVLNKAREQNIDLSPSDFFDTAVISESPPAAPDEQAKITAVSAIYDVALAAQEFPDEPPESPVTVRVPPSRRDALRLSREKMLKRRKASGSSNRGSA